jgi:hypothetical protein
MADVYLSLYIYISPLHAKALLSEFDLNALSGAPPAVEHVVKVKMLLGNARSLFGEMSCC